ncbi:MAG: methyltransferase domain-containing protein [Actinomycetota bacterium]|nr:methyltransferase domain-containing protein [Actinomycetota bacterium]
MKVHAFRHYVPENALPIARSVYRIYERIVCWYTGWWDRRYVERTNFAHLPPASLRYRVHGSPHIDGFLKVGKRSSEDIQAALKRVGKDLSSFQNILDFGCGCGRTLLWFADHSQASDLYGTDIDAEAISWCRNNLEFAKFDTNGPLPPLEYSSGKFDLIYSISVFTHLNEAYQFRWLNELRRITSPGGIVVLTLHGRPVWKDLPQEDVVEIRRRGFRFIAANHMKGVFPEWYQNAYHTKRYVLEQYANYFDVVDYIPRGSGRQDVVILQRP